MTRIILRALTLLAIFVATPVLAQPSSSRAQVEKAIDDTKAAMSGDPELAIGKAIVARTLAQRMTGPDRDRELATAIWLQGVASMFSGKPDEAGRLLAEALRLVERSARGTKLNGDILLARGNWYADRADIGEALKSYQDAYKVYVGIGETAGQAKALVCIAGIYLDANDFKTAITNFDKALALDIADPQTLISIHGNRGDALRELKQFDQAEAEFRKALDLLRKTPNSTLEARVLRNMTRNELAAGKVVQAEATIAEGFKLIGRNAGSDSAQLWALSAKAAFQRHKLGEARTRIERALALAGNIAGTVNFWEAHNTAYQIYKGVGDKAQALAQLQIISAIDAKTTTTARSVNTALMSARFDSANQELKIANLQADEAKRRANTQFWVFVATSVVSTVVFGMLAFGLVTLRKSRNQVRAANVDLESTNAALGKALAAKTEFLATTSHEIRTPLNGILGMTQVMLADTRLDAGVRDRIGVVHGAGVSMRALVDDILDVAKMETGNLTIERAPLDLSAMLRDVSRMWEDQAAAKGVGFDLDLAGSPGRIESDPARLRQVIFNLLSNALKFTQNGSIAVTTGVEQRDGAEVVTVAIRDSGIGIPPEKLELIFESFRQADAGTTRQFGGTGLGLAICRNIARALDGDVTVESVEGEGSLFTLVLPLVRAPEEEAPVAVEEGGQALLIVDKNPISRAVLKTLFAPRVAALKVAGSVEEAAEMIAGGGIERVLTDEITVAADGDAEAGIRALAGVPLALLWTNPDGSDRARLTAAGAAQIIAKPIAGAALVREIVTAPVHDLVASRAA